MYVELAGEDLEDGEEGKDLVGKLNMLTYGSRDAAANWEKTREELLTRIGFTTRESNPCVLHRKERDLAVLVHGDDYFSSGAVEDLRRMKNKIAEKLSLKMTVIGWEEGEKKEVQFLNRVVRYEDQGVFFEPDLRHTEM